jgi:hypothetical protein
MPYEFNDSCKSWGFHGGRWCLKSRSSGLWRRVVLWQDTNFSEVRTSPWRWRQHGILPQHYMASQPRRPRLQWQLILFYGYYSFSIPSFTIHEHTTNERALNNLFTWNSIPYGGTAHFWSSCVRLRQQNSGPLTRSLLSQCHSPLFRCIFNFTLRRG